MKRSLPALAATVLLAICAAGRAQAASDVVVAPDWLRRPTDEATAAHFPPVAAAVGIAGYALLDCSVDAKGVLVNCRATSEKPTALGFGAAAVALSAEMLMRPRTLNGKPVDGGVVRIPIRFQPQPAGPNIAPPQPISEAAGRQAYRAVDAVKYADTMTAAFERNLVDSGVFADTVTPAETRTAVVNALRRAFQAHRDDLRTAAAEAIASVLSEEEMAALADFNIASGDIARNNAAFTATQVRLGQDLSRDVVARSRASFCEKIACVSASDLEQVWRATDPRDAGRIDNPQWAVQPGENIVAGVRPPITNLLGLRGAVRLTCRVDEDGRLQRCVVDQQAPAGLGFGQAALALATGYRLSEIQLAAGAKGRQATVRIGFPAPPVVAPLKVSPGSPQAVTLARQLTAGDETLATRRRDLEIQILGLAARPPPGSDQKVYEAALDAYRDGAQQAIAYAIDQSANAWSTSFSEQQLASLAAFRTSPAGKAQITREAELNTALANALGYVYERVIVEARADYCQLHDCEAQPPAAQSSRASAAPSTRTP